jgi:hypothetical protein
MVRLPTISRRRIESGNGPAPVDHRNRDCHILHLAGGSDHEFGDERGHPSFAQRGSIAFQFPHDTTDVGAWRYAQTPSNPVLVIMDGPP